MRAPAVEKLGYYPTPDVVTQAIISWLASPKPSRSFDPCCGKGLALEAVSQALHLKSYGIELSPVRFADAKTHLDVVENASYNEVQVGENSMGLLWLNPPYEHNHITKKRQEEEFLQWCAHDDHSSSKLMPGGILVYIIQQQTLMVPGVAKCLVQNFSDIRVFRFPDEEFKVFNQIVVFGVKSKNIILGEDPKKITALGNPSYQLPVLEAVSEPVYIVPATRNDQAIRFYRKYLEPSEVIALGQKYGAHKTKSFMDAMVPDFGHVQVSHPVMPLKKGHIARLIASGLLNNMRLTDPVNGEPVLIKGRIIKKRNLINKKDDLEDDSKEVRTYRDRFYSSIALTRQFGMQIIKGEDVEGLTEFITTFGKQIAEHILKSFTPLYNFDPTAAEMNVALTLGKNRRALPGQDEPGLLPAQIDAAIAAMRCLNVKRICNIQGEMGLGKTTIAAAVLVLLAKIHRHEDAFPAIITCPPHLVPKWIDELKEVIPDVQVREIKRIGVENGRQVNDIRSFLDDCKAGKLGKYPVAVMANSKFKMGAGWEPKVWWRTTQNGGHYAPFAACPKCGGVVHVKRRNGESFIPTSEEMLPTNKRLFCQHMVSGWAVDEAGRSARDPSGQRFWADGSKHKKTETSHEHVCGYPLFSYTKDRRMSPAEYILKHCHHEFGTYIADEVHQFKGETSDRGIAFQQMVKAVKNTITLTGTFFGGNSSSIFYLMHRLDPSVRDDFRFDEVTRWVRMYGIEEISEKSFKNSDDTGYTGNNRTRSEPKEKPGVSPEIITRLLDNTIFMSLKDLGIELTSYDEELVKTEMAPLQAGQYGSMYDTLKELAMKSNRFLSVWFQNSLCRPNSAFRDEKVLVPPEDTDPFADLHHKKVIKNRNPENMVEIMDLPAVIMKDDIQISGDRMINVLPKEAWLAAYVLQEAINGRKCLIYVRQTGTRDIRDRIEKVLNKAGVKTCVLSTSVSPERRIGWVKQHTVDADCMICNPKLVETGMDLIMFSTVIFFEVEYSLYTLWQAVRRVWRLGQRNNVKAVFSIYDETLEQQAISVMGGKMKAAQTVYGDDVSGIIVEEEEEDLMSALTRDILNNSEIKDLQQLFSDKAKKQKVKGDNIVLPTKPENAVDVKAVSPEEMQASRPQLPAPELPIETATPKPEVPVKPIAPKTPAEESWEEYKKRMGIGAKPAAKKKFGNSITQDQQPLF